MSGETRKLILLVDDNEVDREHVIRLMRDRYDFEQAATGREGLASFERRKPDCVLLDYRLPDLDGIELLPKLRERGVALVMLTGQGNESVAVKALKEGARDYIVKDTLTKETLRLGIQTAIETQELQNKLERYRLVVESMPIGVMVLRAASSAQTPTFHCFAINSAAAHAAQVNANDVAGSSLADSQVACLGPTERQVCLDALADGVVRDLPQLRHGGAAKPDEIWDIKAVPLSREELVVVFDNVTERVNAQEKQQLAEKQLETAQRLEAVGRLAGGVAHDFNNLLTVIIGYSELARARNARPEAVQEGLAQIHRAAGRAAELTRQLLAFSRRQIISPKILTLNSIVSDMSKMVQRLIGEDIDFMTVLGDDLWQINADAGQVEQVIMNLAVNARDAMPDGGKITLDTRNVELGDEYCRAHNDVRPGSYVQLAISDTGTGMDAATQARIFEPFFTTKEKGRGTGLGLAMVYGIVKQNGGHLSVYSELGSGTTFKIYWPRVMGPTEQAVAPANSGEMKGKETILLVEDEEQVRGYAAIVLSDKGYNVIEATDGADAIAKAESSGGPIDLLVTDVVMPKMNGRALAEQLTKGRAKLKVLFMSGYTANAIVHHGVLTEGINFLAKPYTPHELAAKVRAILDATT